LLTSPAGFLLVAWSDHTTRSRNIKPEVVFKVQEMARYASFCLIMGPFKGKCLFLSVTSVPALCDVHCQEYCTLRHASLNRAVLETYSVVSSRHLCLELPTLFLVICVTCVYAYNCASVHTVTKKLGYATCGVPYISCSRIFQSRIFHPCSLVPIFPVPHFPVSHFQRPHEKQVGGQMD